MLILFTNPLRPLFKRDIFHVMSLPADSHFQYSYKDDYVLQELKQNQNQTRFLTRALLVAAEWKKAGANRSHEYRFFPLRWVQIEDIKPTDQSILIKFKLLDFPDCNVETRERFQATIEKLDHRPGKASPSSNHYQCEVSEEQLEFIQGVNKNQFLLWETIVSQLVKEKSFRDDVFFYFDAEETKHLLGSMKQRLGSIKKLLQKLPFWPSASSHISFAKYNLPTVDIRCGVDFQFSLYAVRGSSSTFSLPKLKLSSEIAAIGGPFVKQHSISEHITFLIKPNLFLQKQLSTLSISFTGSHKDDEESESNKPSGDLTSINLLLECHPSKYGRGWTILLLAIGFGLISVNTDTAESIVGLMDWTKEDASSLAFIMKFIGACSIAGAYLFGLNRLPYKI
jgi:hypothetical protein